MPRGVLQEKEANASQLKAPLVQQRERSKQQAPLHPSDSEDHERPSRSTSVAQENTVVIESALNANASYEKNYISSRIERARTSSDADCRRTFQAEIRDEDFGGFSVLNGTKFELHRQPVNPDVSYGRTMLEPPLFIERVEEEPMGLRVRDPNPQVP